MHEDDEPPGRTRVLPSGLLPIFFSKHLAAQAVARNQAEGYLKRCVHLTIRQDEQPHSVSMFYQVVCEQDSFEPNDDPTKERSKFIGGCPKRCRMYQRPWRGKFSRWLRARHPLVWFAQRPWQTQVAIILAPLLALAIVFHVVKDLIGLGGIIYKLIRG